MVGRYIDSDKIRLLLYINQKDVRDLEEVHAGIDGDNNKTCHFETPSYIYIY